MFTKIVIGLDGSETSERAVHLGCDLAEKYDAEIHLVHTPQPETVAYAMGAVSGFHAATTMPSATDVTAAGTKVLDAGKAIVAECGQRVTQTHLQLGDPAHVMVDYAEECGADLIVLGRRGVGALSALVLGSTTQRVNHLAKCACLSVM